jgi:pyridoxine 4-dehydrogenase
MAHHEALLAGLRMARQGAVAESADVGFVDDVDDAARCGQKTHPHHHHRVEDDDLRTRLHPQAGPTLHAPVQDGVGGLLESLPTGADPGFEVKVAISLGPPTGRGRAHLRVRERKFPERSQVHPPSLPRRDAPSSLRRTVGQVTTQPVAQSSGTFTIGGDLTVNRLGFGAMRLTGKGVWGPPADRAECVRVLRRAVELGVNFIDTADSYGPYYSEEIIHEALHPYDGLVIATKAGLLRTGPDIWIPLGNPTYLRQECEMSLRRLGVDTIDLFQLHRIDPDFPLAAQLGELVTLKNEGKIRHIGLSEVTVDQLTAAQQITEIVSVQNMYNLVARGAEPLLDAATEQGIGFIPWFPLAAGPLANPDGPLQRIAAEHYATPSQLALAWLLHRSPVMLPIPGTSQVAHLEENVAAAGIALSDDEFESLSVAGTQRTV